MLKMRHIPKAPKRCLNKYIAFFLGHVSLQNVRANYTSRANVHIRTQMPGGFRKAALGWGRLKQYVLNSFPTCSMTAPDQSPDLFTLVAHIFWEWRRKWA